MKSESLTLTVGEIADLARCAGLVIKVNVTGAYDDDDDDDEMEITIEPCPKQGVEDEDSRSIVHCKHIAYITEYPEEGVYPLGKQPEQKDDNE